MTNTLAPLTQEEIAAMARPCGIKTPDFVLFVSGGNDSVALVWWAHLEKLENVAVVYCNTRWSTWWWPERVKRFQSWVESLGFTFCEIWSEGMEALIRRKKAWPANGMQFCTTELKLKPAIEWLEIVDPYKSAVCMVGIRRAESEKRRSWPRIVERSENHGGRELISPLADCSDPDRDELVIDAGWVVLPHRSKECEPCVNANKTTFRQLHPSDVDKVRRNEAETGRTMFRPHRFMNAKGIDQVLTWAGMDQRGLDFSEDSGCDSGMCGG